MRASSSIESCLRAGLSAVCLTALSLSVAACRSDGGPGMAPGTGTKPPAVTADGSGEAPDPGPTVPPNPQSTSRPLAWVNGEVVTYRDVLREVGPQLRVLQDPSQRRQLEDPALLKIVRQRLVYQASRTAGVRVQQSEIERHVTITLRELKQTGGTLDAFLRERDMTRREYEEAIRRELSSQKFMFHSIGRGTDPNVIVRPRADTYVAPGEVRKFYDRHPERFQEPATAQFRMLALRPDRKQKDRSKAAAETKAALEALRQKLLDGADWVPLYREIRDGAGDEDKLDGLHIIREGESKHAVWINAFAFESEKGVTSSVLQKGNTFVLLYAEGARAARLVPYSEVQNSIRSDLATIKRAAAAYEVELDLLRDAAIEPDSLRDELRSTLRVARRKLVEETGF